MSAKHLFALNSHERRPLPTRIIIGQRENERLKHVVLKFLAHVLFYRERVQVEPNLGIDSIPFAPDIVQLDFFTLRTREPRTSPECEKRA